MQRARPIGGGAWTPVEFTRTVRTYTKTPRPVTIDAKKLALFWDAASGSPAIADDVCWHRGASLSAGGAVQAQGCVSCKYHGHLTMASRDLHLLDRHGITWMKSRGLGRGGGGDDFPPASWEFDDPSQRTFEYSRSFRGCNPILTLENTLDFAHLETVHFFHLVEGRPRVEVHKGGYNGKASYAYDSKAFNLVIENEYWAPWSSCLRFIFDGVQSFTLHFSVRPESPHSSTVFVRVTRKRDGLGALGDAAYMAINELPLWEDRYIVQHADATAWSKNTLTKDDAFLECYRTYMRDNHPDILDTYVQ
jgi:phenylpropionate dioxygenase-like ring-hydroxylating dioxygenase large terminal subunit